MVSYIGWKELGLSAPDDLHARAVIDRAVARLRNLAEDVIDVRVHIKGASRYGRPSRYEIRLAILCASGPVYAQAIGWGVMDVIHQAFDSAENQIKHRVAHEAERYMMH